MSVECKAPGCLRPIWSNGFCHKHYDEARGTILPTCSKEGCGKHQHARGLCNQHYRQMVRSQGALCAVKDCGRPVQANGLCTTHYRRQRLYGSLDPTRPEDWGSREKHPLYNSWHWLLRQRTAQFVCEEWRQDFWQFVRDLGPRPERHKIDRKDKTRPHGPGNTYWRAPVLSEIEASNKREYMREYQHRNRVENPRVYRAHAFGRKYGITFDQYEAMVKAQNGLCAICEKPQAFVHPKTGEPVNLSVDHCHRTGKVRQLLCSKCNTALGALDDNVDLLRKAIEYIERHAKLQE